MVKAGNIMSHVNHVHLSSNHSVFLAQKSSSVLSRKKERPEIMKETTYEENVSKRPKKT